MDITTKEQQNALVVGIKRVNILLTILYMVLMVTVVCSVWVKWVNIENNWGSQAGTTSYVTQLESLAGSKGYTTEDKVTYKERQQLETEEDRYVEVMKYLEDTEVSESEFKDIKEIQSKYQQSVQQVNKIGIKSYAVLIFFLFVIVVFSGGLYNELSQI